MRTHKTEMGRKLPQTKKTLIFRGRGLLTKNQVILMKKITHPSNILSLDILGDILKIISKIKNIL